MDGFCTSTFTTYQIHAQYNLLPSPTLRLLSLYSLPNQSAYTPKQFFCYFFFLQIVNFANQSNSMTWQLFRLAFAVSPCLDSAPIPFKPFPMSWLCIFCLSFFHVLVVGLYLFLIFICNVRLIPFECVPHTFESVSIQHCDNLCFFLCHKLVMD